MKRIDLDDLPPKLAAVLAGVEAGEEILLVKGGAVVGRLTGGGPVSTTPTQADSNQTPDERAREIFEQFRASIEDEF